MTELLEKAFARAAQLPAAEQEAFAQFVLAELESEARWARAFAGSQDELASLAQKAVADYKAGRTRGERDSMARLSAQYLDAARDPAREREARTWVEGVKKK